MTDEACADAVGFFYTGDASALNLTTTTGEHLSFSANGKRFVTVHADGRVEVAEGVTVDEAARVFWDAVQAVAGWKGAA